MKVRVKIQVDELFRVLSTSLVSKQLFVLSPLSLVLRIFCLISGCHRCIMSSMQTVEVAPANKDSKGSHPGGVSWYVYLTLPLEYLRFLHHDFESTIFPGKDVIGLAETGSGKTAAFALPILQVLLENPQRLFALIITPTRELAFQISEQIEALGASVGVKCGMLW